MEPVTEQEQSEFREILSVIYGLQANKWNINLNVLELFRELLLSSESCSRYMDMVPRPFGAGSAINWARRQARDAIIRHFKNGGEHYLICLRAPGLKMKTRFHLAAQGH